MGARPPFRASRGGLFVFAIPQKHTYKIGVLLQADKRLALFNKESAAKHRAA